MKYAKVTLRLSEEQVERLSAVMKWGQRDKFFRRFIEAVCEAAEQDPGFVSSVLIGATRLELGRVPRARP